MVRFGSDIAATGPIAANSNSTFFRNRRVLVTGGGGLLGSAFVAQLLSEGAAVRTTAHQRPVPFGSEVRIISADLRDPGACERAVQGVECVIHAAGVSGGSKRMSIDPFPMFNDNIVMNTNILEASRRAGVEHYLFVSNSSVYAPSQTALREEEAWGDNLKGSPENETGAVKRAGEAQCGLYAKVTGMRLSIMRAANAYGPHDCFDPEFAHVVGALIRKVCEDRHTLQLWGDGRPVRDFIHSSDVARAGMHLLQIAERGDCYPVNIGTDRPVTILELAEIALAAAEQSQRNIRFETPAPIASPCKRLSLERMRQIGFVPRISLEAGLRDTIQWYREHAQR